MYEPTSDLGLPGPTLRARSSFSPLLDVGQVFSSRQTLGSELHPEVKKRRGHHPPDAAAKEKTPTPARRDAFARHVKHAQRVVEKLEKARRCRDLVELSNQGFELLRTLDDLWGIRADCDEDWRDLLNMFQGVLKGADFELLTLEQCLTVRDVVDESLGRATIDAKGLEEVVLQLDRAGLSPFGAISGDESSRD